MILRAPLIASRGPVEHIAGIPFGPDPDRPHLADLAQCLLCGIVVDIGGEARNHIIEHQVEDWE